MDMHDVLLAHQPQPELAKHVPQDGRLSHPALAASTCANASRAVLKPMTGPPVWREEAGCERRVFAPKLERDGNREYCRT